MLYEYIYDSIIYSMYVFFLSCLYARLRAFQVPLKITTVKLHFSWNYQEMCQINYCKIMISVKCNIFFFLWEDMSAYYIMLAKTVENNKTLFSIV